MRKKSWFANGAAIVDAEGHRIAWCGRGMRRGASMKLTDEEQAENVRLMVAAPRLYDAVELAETLLVEVARMSACKDERSIIHETIDHIQEVLAYAGRKNV